MSIDLYGTPASAPCRSVNLVVSALGIDDKIKQINLDLMTGEQLKPDFVKLNPQHTMPTIVDDGFSLWESRAISRYLVNKYGGPDNSLYPKDPKTRALVDQRLDFDLGTLYSKFGTYFYPQFMGGKNEESDLHKLKDALGFLNAFLEGQKYAVGDNLTIADLSLVATVSTIDIAGINLQEYPNIVRWYELVKKTAPNYQKANEEAVASFKAFIDSRK